MPDEMVGLWDKMDIWVNQTHFVGILVTKFLQQTWVFMVHCALLWKLRPVFIIYILYISIFKEIFILEWKAPFSTRQTIWRSTCSSEGWIILTCGRTRYTNSNYSKLELSIIFCYKETTENVMIPYYKNGSW